MTGRTHTARAITRRLAALRGGTAMSAVLVFSGLLSGLACVGLAAPAQAQGFNGTVASSTGVSINAGNTDVTVLGQEAIINWNATGATASDTNVDFLPSGGSVLFHDLAGSSSGSFTVLNRITPTYTDVATGATTNLAATISLSGTVNSTVSVPNGAGGFNSVQGGNVWFYSPYGIIANGTSAFNVGSLLLTTSDIDTSNGGSLYLSSPGGQKIGFLQATQSGSSVKILPGAQINAAGDPTVPNSAYVGVFAPRIEQGGTISSDGMTALVAGEAGTITFNLGLIDVAVTTGTTDANGIVHTGTTGGPASGGEPQTVALVAMPQNAALTMLLSGSIGYTPATIGTPDGSAVVLTAGYDPALPAATLAAGYGNIQIANVDFPNQLNASATGAIDVSATAARLTRFGGTTSLSAGRLVSMTANAGQEIRADGALFLSSLLPNQAADMTVTVTGGTATIPTDGKIDVADVLYLSANATPVFGPVTSSTGASNTGGTVTVSVSKGTFSATNGLNIDASGTGESGLDFGGAGKGGIISITALNKGTINVGSFYASANGFGGSGNGSVAAPSVGVGGDGHGGTITISDGDTVNGFGTLALNFPYLNAQGFGSSGASVSGSGFGGAIGISIGAAETWGVLIADASANNGGLQATTTDLGNATAQLPGTPGNLSGIAVTISGNGALTLTSASLANNANVTGGSTAAYAGQAGGVVVTVQNGGALTVANDLNMHADAGPPPDSGLGSVEVAPTMSGGAAGLIADTGGTITLGQFTITANATAYGAGVTGSTATGGSAQVSALNSGSITLTQSLLSTVSADGYGAVGPAPSDARGGVASVVVSDGTIQDSGGSTLLVSGSALSGGVNYQFSTVGQGFNADGNQALLVVDAGVTGTGRIAINTVDLRAKGNATLEFLPDAINGPLSFTSADILPINGNGGIGKGGLAEARVFAGSLQVNTLSAQANGIGGSSGFSAAGSAAYVSGNGTGGQASLLQTGGTLNAGTMDLVAVGYGGGYNDFDVNGGVMPLAGTGFGGVARATLAGGTTTLTSALTLDGGAIGGAGSSTSDTTITGGNGGLADASGGIAELLMPAGSTALLTSPTITVRATGLGGAGGASSNVSAAGTSGDGGNAIGGTARLNLADGGITVSGSTAAFADATGGAGNTGGNATAGTAGFLLADTVAAPSTTRSLGPLLLSATPTGGTGAVNSGTTTAGNTLFTARPGTLAAALTINGDFTAIAPGATAPVGDGFTGDFGAFPVTITGNALISTTRDVTAVASGGGANIGGTLTINGRTVTTSGGGDLSVTGNVAVNATAAINIAGVSSGGTTLLVAQDPLSGNYGPVHVGNLNSVGLVTVQSSAFDAGSTGALSFADSFATTGDFIVTTAADLTVANLSAGGNVSLTSIGGNLVNTGTVSGTAVTLDAGGNVAINGPLIVPGLLTVAAGGAVTTAVPLFAGSVDIIGAGGITIASLSSLGTTSLRAPGGAILIGDLASVDLVTIAGQSAQVVSSGALAVASATTTAGDLSIQAVDGLTVTTASAAGNLTLGSSAGGVLATGAVSATGNAAIFGATGVTMNALTSGGTTDLQGGSGAVTVTDLASVGAVTIGGSAITLGSTRAQPLLVTAANAGTGAITMNVTGDLTVGDPLASGASISGGAITLTSSSGSIHQLGQMSGTSETFSAGSNIVVDGTIAATGAFNAAAGGLFTLTGTAAAGTIAINSADIQIGALAQLGVRGLTSSIALTNTGGAGTFIGDPVPATGWRLDAAEAARLFADQSISVAVSPPANGGAVADVVIGSLSLSYGPAATTNGPSPNLGNGGTFAVLTPGRIAVTGAVAFNSSAANDTFSLSAGTIDLIGDTGSIALLDALGGLSGTLNLSAGTIRAETAAAFAATAAGGSLYAISARLDQTDGVVKPGGYFQANAITVDVTNRFFIQNTGAGMLPVDRRGFTANSLAIATPSGAVDIAINGVLLDTKGALITGLDTQHSVLVNGVAASAAVGGFSPLSTINGCVIGLDCSIPVVVVAPPGPIVDILPKPPVSGGPDPLLNLPIIQFGSPPLLDSPPLIDEPVTGVGNDDLWQRQCGADSNCHG